MPSPTSALATQRPDLAASFEEYDLEASRAGFVGNQIFPTMEVNKQAGSFGRIPIESLLANRETRRAPGAGYSRGDWKFTPDSYATEEHGAEEPIDDREAAIYKDYFEAEQIAAARAKDVVLRNAERRIADLLFNTTTFSGRTGSITHEWDDAANAVPITDVETAARAVWSSCGLWPNALVINKHVFRNLRMCESIAELMKFQGFQDVRPSKITAATLASVFDLDYVIVADAAKNSAAEGQSASIAKVWSDEYALVARICQTNDIREPGLGRNFYWTGDGSSFDGRVETYRDETKRSDIVRFRHEVDEKLLYVECGYLISNVTT